MTKESFLQAQQDVKKLTKKPDDMSLLKLYALFKQGSEGDVQGDRPGMMNFVARAKYDAWAGLIGKTIETAQEEYVNFVAQLQEQFS